ncbi:hypothetical protein [Streptomyces tsukubensis]|uniref:Bacterial Ig domain-containing protein n=1 Tax=Streptomyces tsukubensis TaxID=83656 RepID=A0A1V4A1B0_9ACTN|nr:hypothetical protein [Streptomyces tsukubensis]OON72170.1 hypothetical protein B1H18_30705 [Streptomyces tsukubensis]QFR97095.1 hypothetical protein GBW32_33585 [Streptomyces tsukubensis]
MNRWKSVLLTGATAAVLVVGPVAGLAAATPETNTAVAAPAKPTLTAKATVSKIKAWQQFRIQGASTHMKSGTRVTLQQKQGKVWKSLPASMNTSRTGTYNLRVKIGIKGHNMLRVVGGGAISPVVNVTVT